MCQKLFLQVQDPVSGSTQLEHRLAFMAPSSPILKPVGIAYTMCRMTVLLLEQVGEDNYENRLIYITITIQQFLDLGGGLPTIHVNIPHIQTQLKT